MTLPAISDDGTSAAAETTDSGGSGSSGAAVICGDNVAAGDEECDNDLDPACHDCIRDRRIFVTAPPEFTADLGSMEEADDECNYRAAVAGLIDPSTYPFKAWLSTQGSSAANRMFHSRGRYVLTSGDIFAPSWDGLVAGQIFHAPEFDEYGEPQSLGVWTGTLPDGAAAPGTNCDDWTTLSLEGKATWGLSDGVGATWTQWTDPDTNPTDCLSSMAFYCVEQ